MVAEEVADMVADIVVGMEVDGMVVDMMDIIKNCPFSMIGGGGHASRWRQDW